MKNPFFYTALILLFSLNFNSCVIDDCKTQEEELVKLKEINRDMRFGIDTLVLDVVKESILKDFCVEREARMDSLNKDQIQNLEKIIENLEKIVEYQKEKIDDLEKKLWECD
jgi:hypothetical protein